MNEGMDPRESYFKNKVNGLMSKETVIKTLNSNNGKKLMGKKKEKYVESTPVVIEPKHTVLLEKKK
jgi:hypothetical protein